MSKKDSQKQIQAERNSKDGDFAMAVARIKTES